MQISRWNTRGGGLLAIIDGTTVTIPPAALTTMRTSLQLKVAIEAQLGHAIDGLLRIRHNRDGSIEISVSRRPQDVPIMFAEDEPGYRSRRQR